MIKSMTGFGNASLKNDSMNLTVEVKSLNSKFLDLNLRLPKLFSDKELELRSMISSSLERGKVSVIIDFVPLAIVPQQQYNEDLFVAYYGALKKLADKVISPEYGSLFSLALSSPGVIQASDGEELSDKLWKLLVEQLNEALTQCNDFRKSEGDSLQKKLVTYLDEIESLLNKVEELDPERVDKIRKRIAGNIETFFGDEGFDKNRLEQEIIFYIEKLDIHEERVRLRSHLDYFREVLKGQSSNGKKLGFIAQEMGREINTIGSKANDAEMQKSVVSMKEELEKIKEQISNVL